MENVTAQGRYAIHDAARDGQSMLNLRKKESQSANIILKAGVVESLLNVKTCLMLALTKDLYLKCSRQIRNLQLEEMRMTEYHCTGLRPTAV